MKFFKVSMERKAWTKNLWTEKKAVFGLKTFLKREFFVG